MLLFFHLSLLLSSFLQLLSSLLFKLLVFLLGGEGRQTQQFLLWDHVRKQVSNVSFYLYIQLHKYVCKPARCLTFKNI